MKVALKILWTCFKYGLFVSLHVAAAFAITGNPVSLLIGSFLVLFWADYFDKRLSEKLGTGKTSSQLTKD